MLSSILIENFKSYRSAELPLGRVTVLVGANASGKSNALEAIRLLSWMAQGNKLSQLQEDVDKSDRVVRGLAKDLVRRGAKGPFSLGCRTVSGKSYTWNARFGVAEDGTLYLAYESGKEDESETVAYAATGMLRGVNETRAPRYADVEIKAGGDNSEAKLLEKAGIVLDSLAFTQLSRFVPRFPNKFSGSESLRALWNALENSLGQILFLDPQPASARGYVALSRKHKLKEDGSNLSAMLYDLWYDEAHKDSNRKNLLSLIQSLPEQDIQSLTFIETPREEVMFALEETFGGVETIYEAALLSDGTIRVVAIAAALLSAPPGSLVIIEEIGNGVHPSRANRLLAEIDRIAAARGLQILISTHNPALLDALPNQAIGDVVFCYRDPVEGDSRLVRLQDLHDYPSLIAQGSIGELLSAGLLDRFVKHHPGPDEKKQQSLNWLKSLQKISAAKCENMVSGSERPSRL